MHSATVIGRRHNYPTEYSGNKFVAAAEYQLFVVSPIKLLKYTTRPKRLVLLEVA